MAMKMGLAMTAGPVMGAIKRGIAAGTVEGIHSASGRLTPAASRYLEGGNYVLSEREHVEMGIRDALVGLGFIRKRWFRYERTAKPAPAVYEGPLP